MNSNFGLLDPLETAGKMKKEEKRARLVERARADFAAWMEAHDLRVGAPAARA